MFLFAGVANAADVQWEEISVFSVPSNTVSPTTGPALMNDALYKVSVEGTFNAGANITADAKYSTREGYGTDWTDLVKGYESVGPTLLDLFVNGTPGDWGTYSDDHKYSMNVLGDGDLVELHIFDTYPINNVGELNVKIEKFVRYGEITAPEEDAKVWGEVKFEAFLMDDDYDYVDWAVRREDCNIGANTVFGNVNGRNDSYVWDYVDYQHDFYFQADMSSLPGGMYCFVLNPREDSGETGIRLTREFYLADGYVHGGGQIIEEVEGDGKKKKDDLMISFGGWAWDLGSAGYFGEWEVNFHNVGEGHEVEDKSKFHTTDIQVMNFYDGNSSTCNDAINFTVNGKLDGEDGYKMIFRAGDNGSPNTMDTVRIEIFKPSGAKIYDTYPNEFTPESSCVGGARTGLDRGNITIVNP